MIMRPILAFVFALVAWSKASPTYYQTPLSSDVGKSLHARSVDVRRFNITSPEQGHRLLDLAKVIRALNMSRAPYILSLTHPTRQDLDADIWTTTPDHIDMVLSSPFVPAQLASFEHSTARHSIPLIHRHPSLLPPSKWDLHNLKTDFHSEYHRVEEVFAFSNELAKAFPHTVELVRLGQSSEDRELLAIRVEKASRCPWRSNLPLIIPSVFGSPPTRNPGPGL